MLYIIGGLSYCCLVYMWLLIEAALHPMQLMAAVADSKPLAVKFGIIVCPILLPFYIVASIYTAIRGK